MPYKNLHELLMHSQSTRVFFLSLPVGMQMELHRSDAFIHTAQQLRQMVENAAAMNRHDVLGRWK